MNLYIGKQIVKAMRMDRKTYLTRSGCPQIEIETIQTFVPGYLLSHRDGHISWMPKKSFEYAYRPVSNGEAYIIELRLNSRKAG